MKSILVFCFMVLLGLAVAGARRPCGCRPVFQFCANDYETYHSICEYKCKHPSTPFENWYILYYGPCHAEPETNGQTTTDISTNGQTTTDISTNGQTTTDISTNGQTTTDISTNGQTTTDNSSILKRTRVVWIAATDKNAASLSDRAVVVGYGRKDDDLWVIRAVINTEVIPGKYSTKLTKAYVPVGASEIVVTSFEVLCAPPDSIQWVPSHDGAVPPNAMVAGHTAGGETLYVGRAKHAGWFTPGKVQPSAKKIYIPFGDHAIPYNTYEVLCTI